MDEKKHSKLYTMDSFLSSLGNAKCCSFLSCKLSNVLILGFESHLYTFHVWWLIQQYKI